MRKLMTVAAAGILGGALILDSLSKPVVYIQDRTCDGTYDYVEIPAEMYGMPASVQYSIWPTTDRNLARERAGHILLHFGEDIDSFKPVYELCKPEKDKKLPTGFRTA